MKFTIKKGKTKSETHTVDLKYMFMFYGFPSDIKDLVLVIEKKGDTQRHEIPSTEFGFALEEISGQAMIWFEFSSTDKDYELTVVAE
jgi:hypothetical protein